MRLRFDLRLIFAFDHDARQIFRARITQQQTTFAVKLGFEPPRGFGDFRNIFEREFFAHLDVDQNLRVTLKSARHFRKRSAFFIQRFEQKKRRHHAVADEAFFSGTAAEITPIREVDRRVIGAGQAGPITQQVQKEYFRIVKGENPAFASWLHEYSF